MADMVHFHPQSGEVIFGECLAEGTVLKEGDCYPADDGTWKEQPGLTGLKTLHPEKVFWVRPSRPNLPLDAEFVLEQIVALYPNEISEDDIDLKEHQFSIFPRSAGIPEFIAVLVDWKYLLKEDHGDHWIFVLTKEGFRHGRKLLS